MPRVNIFIRKENEDKWNSLVNKSQWVNDRLADGGIIYPAMPIIEDIELKNPTDFNPYTHAVVQAAKGKGYDDVEEDPYPGYKIHRITGDVVDTVNQEQVEEVDKEMLDYLKKNGRYI